MTRLRRPPRGLLDRITAPIRLNWYRALRSNDAAHVVAGGLAVGTFWAFSPFMGTHMVMAVATAHLAKVSRMAAAVAAWISNPITAVPIYGFNFLIGALITPADPDSPLRNPSFLVEDGFSALSQIDFMDLATLMLGSLIVGFISAYISYKVCYSYTEKFLTKRALRRSKRQERERLKLERRATKDARKAEKKADRAEKRAEKVVASAEVALRGAVEASLKAGEARAEAQQAARDAEEVTGPHPREQHEPHEAGPDPRAAGANEPPIPTASLGEPTASSTDPRDEEDADPSAKVHG